MSKTVRILIVIILCTCLCAGCMPQSDKSDSKDGRPLVYASFYPMYDFAKKAAGELAEVRCFIPDGTEPHDWEPSAQDIIQLEHADMFIYSSDDFETWVDSVIPQLQNEELVVVETYDVLFDEKMIVGYLHEWLDSHNARLQFGYICDSLIRADPENKDGYEENRAHWMSEFDKLCDEYDVLKDMPPESKIIVTHAAFDALCARYDNIEQIAIAGSSPEDEPNLARMAEIVALAKENNIQYVFYEELSSPKLAETVAREIGGKTLPLNPIEGLSDEQRENGDDYFSIMRKNLASLKEALA